MTGYALELAKEYRWLTEQEVNFLYRIITPLPKNAVCVNIGAGAGTSAMAIADVRPDLIPTIYTIDIQPDTTPNGGLGNEKDNFAKYGVPCPSHILGYSWDIGKSWNRGKVDYILVDGSHSVDGVEKDIESWTPLLRSMGTLVFHDYGSEMWLGVKIVVDSIIKPKYGLIDNVGMLIAFMNTE